MKHPKLRIAWSVAWGVLAVLLCMLWVRSYWYRDILVHCQGSNAVGVGYECGTILCEKNRSVGSGWSLVRMPVGNSLRFPQRILFGWEDRRPDYIRFVVRIWFLLPIVAGLVAVPWFQWSNRFSLSTLLIATTLLAVALGLLAWLSNR